MSGGADGAGGVFGGLDGTAGGDGIVTIGVPEPNSLVPLSTGLSCFCSAFGGCVEMQFGRLVSYDMRFPRLKLSFGS